MMIIRNTKSANGPFLSIKIFTYGYLKIFTLTKDLNFQSHVFFFSLLVKFSIALLVSFFF